MKHLRTLAVAGALAAAACSSDSAKNADTAAVMADTTGMAAPADTAMAVPSTTAATGRLDPNSASAADLAVVPGVTPALAEAIVAARPYTDNSGVDKVLGTALTEPQRDSIYSHLWIPLDLNKATGDEILLIPGVGARMRREFLEYRPYTSIEQFRREIGKYVDKDEVARLESYVRI